MGMNCARRRVLILVKSENFPRDERKKVCYLHGGKSKGAPIGNRNALKHGNFTAEAFERRYNLRMLLKQSKELIKEIGVSTH
jgi:hypothetical protein